ncbi:MAG TPA: hypothetical protein VMT90_10860 [Dehalococcoidia bacterium]|jgi:hypothetical protein|nr:hypothetical protein [Dehalococcoidia bacterium]
MSLVVTVYVPSGIVMAADSRMTVLRAEDRGEGEQKTRVEQQLVLSDSAYKIVELKTVAAGVSVYDAGVIDNQPVDSQVRRFEEEALAAGDDVRAVADKFMQHFQSKHAGVNVGFHVAGYRIEGRASVPYVLVGHTTREPAIRRVNATDEGVLQYGVVRAGDVLVANRLIDANFLPLFAAMPIQDAIDYAVHLIRTTIDTLRFEPRYPSVGGPIDVLVLTPDGMRWVQRKELHGRG